MHAVLRIQHDFTEACIKLWRLTLSCVKPFKQRDVILLQDSMLLYGCAELHVVADQDSLSATLDEGHERGRLGLLRGLVDDDDAELLLPEETKRGADTGSED